MSEHPRVDQQVDRALEWAEQASSLIQRRIIQGNASKKERKLQEWSGVLGDARATLDSLAPEGDWEPDWIYYDSYQPELRRFDEQQDALDYAEGEIAEYGGDGFPEEVAHGALVVGRLAVTHRSRCMEVKPDNSGRFDELWTVEMAPPPAPAEPITPAGEQGSAAVVDADAKGGA